MKIEYSVVGHTEDYTKFELSAEVNGKTFRKTGVFSSNFSDKFEKGQAVAKRIRELLLDAELFGA